MNDISYIYGDSNGASYVEEAKTSDQTDQRRTHWDPRLEIRDIAGTVQVGIVPPSKDISTDEAGVWISDDGQYLSLSRSGINRAIAALREARDSAYGKDE